jgi:hypothetical protein
MPKGGPPGGVIRKSTTPRSTLSTRPILIPATSSSLIMTTILARPHTIIRKSTTPRSTLSTRPILIPATSSSLMKAALIQDTWLILILTMLKSLAR